VASREPRMMAAVVLLGSLVCGLPAVAAPVAAATAVRAEGMGSTQVAFADALGVDGTSGQTVSAGGGQLQQAAGSIPAPIVPFQSTLDSMAAEVPLDGHDSAGDPSAPAATQTATILPTAVPTASPAPVMLSPSGSALPLGTSQVVEVRAQSWRAT
jgi:hypothetical protein